ncbi:hypothetical protein [Streptomyces sp. URMC 124]|uniref:hypothetical protein n=1 Tax=Streptomyces sp. URMC 124 TaxID=3423405 RepID=UPI003F1AF8D8
MRESELAAMEEYRGEGLTARIVDISSDPQNPSNSCLDLYQAAVQDAFSNAARYGSQPGEGWS